MLSILEFLITMTGIALIVGIVGSYIDKDGKWVAIVRKVTLYGTRISPILLAVYVMLLTFEFTSGILSFSLIGIYVACGAIIISSAKELFGKSTFASDLATVASYKASKMQDDVARKAAQLADDARKAAAEQKKAAEESSQPKA